MGQSNIPFPNFSSCFFISYWIHRLSYACSVWKEEKDLKNIWYSIFDSFSSSFFILFLANRYWSVKGGAVSVRSAISPQALVRSRQIFGWQFKCKGWSNNIFKADNGTHKSPLSYLHDWNDFISLDLNNLSGKWEK